MDLNENHNRKLPKDSFMFAFGLYGTIGFQLAITVVGGLFLGQYVDRKLGTDPWMTLVGLIIGAVGGFYNLLRIIKWKEKKKGE